jgi:hypothetical protein
MPIAVIYNGGPTIGVPSGHPRRLPLMGAGLLLPLVIMWVLACL